MYLWRAVDSEGAVLDFLIQPKRDKKAALKFMRRLFKRQGFVPEWIVTDKPRPYSSSPSQLGPAQHHERGKHKNNRAENSHQPVRGRERKMQPFKSAGAAQRFHAVHAAVYNHFSTQRHPVSRKSHRLFHLAAARRREESPSAFAKATADTPTPERLRVSVHFSLRYFVAT